MATDISKIRNVGFAGHGGVGKTSLVESILFAAGAVNRLGKVDDGTTTTDFDPDEIKRKISLNTAAAFCDHKGHRLNLIDTPGYGDFVADARAGLRVAGAAIVVVDAVAGVQVQTEKVWKFANEYNLPRAIVIKLNRETVRIVHLPDVKQRFRDSLAGAIVAVMTWIGLSYLLGLYFRHFDSLDKTYGPLGAAIGLYVWFYLSGFAILIGGEINFLLGELRNDGASQSPAPARTQINNLNAAA